MKEQKRERDTLCLLISELIEAPLVSRSQEKVKGRKLGKEREEARCVFFYAFAPTITIEVEALYFCVVNPAVQTSVPFLRKQ